MTDREYVLQEYPAAFLDSVKKTKLRIVVTEYKVRASRPSGNVIGTGSTRHIAWNNGKATVKLARQND